MKKFIFLFFLIVSLCFFTVGCKKNGDDADKNDNTGGEDEVEGDWGDLNRDQQNDLLYDLI